MLYSAFCREIVSMKWLVNGQRIKAKNHLWNEMEIQVLLWNGIPDDERSRNIGWIPRWVRNILSMRIPDSIPKGSGILHCHYEMENQVPGTRFRKILAASQHRHFVYYKLRICTVELSNSSLFQSSTGMNWWSLCQFSGLHGTRISL